MDYQFGNPRPFQSEMLYESFPGIRTASRCRTTSESSSFPKSPSTRKRNSSMERPSQKTLMKENVPCVADVADSEMRQRSGSKGFRDFFRNITKPVNEDVAKKKNKNTAEIQGTSGESHIQNSRLMLLKETFRPRSQSDASSVRRRHRAGTQETPGRSIDDAERGEADVGCHGNGVGNDGNAPFRFHVDRCDGNSASHSANSFRGSKSGDHSGSSRGGNTCRSLDSNGLDATLYTLRVSGFSIGNGYDAKDPNLSPLSPVGKLKTPNHIGPQEFIEMYRNRAYSDPKPQARMEALAKLRMKRPKSTRLADSPGFVGMDSLNEKKLVLWRDKNEGTQLIVLPTDSSADNKVETIELNEDVEMVYWNVLKATKCYDIIPNSTKLVILDSELSVKKALYALLNNGIRAAPIWHSKRQKLSGMLSVTDFIRVLQRYYHSKQDPFENLEDHTIWSFKSLNGSAAPCPDQLRTIRPDESLLDAIFALRENAIHRLPVIDPSTGNILYMLTYKRLFSFLKMATRGNGPKFMNKTIEELEIGTFENIATVHLETPVISALEILIERGVSSLPVVDSDRKFVAMYSRAYVINMAAEKTYNQLDMTIGEARNGQSSMLYNENVLTCEKTETLLSVVTKLSRWETRRLPVIDTSGVVEGIVSVSDVLHYIADQEKL